MQHTLTQFTQAINGERHNVLYDPLIALRFCEVNDMGEQVSRYLVYGLIDPRTNELRYVGKSSYGLERPKQHRQQNGRSHHTHVSHWLRKLYSDDQCKPSIIVLSECESKADAEREEIKLIAFFRLHGYDLTNLTDGGGGNLGHPLSESTKNKLRLKLRERMSNPEFVKKLSIANRGRIATEDQIAKLRHYNATRVLSEESKRKFSQAMKGVPKSMEWRARMSVIMTGKTKSPETRKKISDSRKRLFLNRQAGVTPCEK